MESDAPFPEPPAPVEAERLASEADEPEPTPEEPVISERSSGGEWMPPSLEELGRMLPQYRIESLLGRGGMGAVYKCWQATLDRPVAIKLLPAVFTQDARFVARFQREARTLAKLQHPRIVTIHDFGQTSEGNLYFVMEYIDGTDLRRVLRGPGLDAEQALGVVGQLCDALQAAHRVGIVHRDIKPENVLITADGYVKLADFGLAQPPREDGVTVLTGTNVIMGTPSYMAPEQFVGGAPADPRSDIFALGVMFYEMLTGRRPQGVFDPPSHRVQVDVRIDGVVLKALQSEPERRYQSVIDLKSDVESIRNTPPPAPRVAVPRPRVVAKPPPARGGKIAVGLLIAALVGVIAYLVRDRSIPVAPVLAAAATPAPPLPSATPPPAVAPTPRASTPLPATPVAQAAAPAATPAPGTPPPTPRATAVPATPAAMVASFSPPPAVLPLGTPRLAPSGPPRVLFFTLSSAFAHPVVRRVGGALSLAEKQLTDAARGKFDVVCTQDASTLNAANLANYAAVVFYTAGELPLTDQGKRDFLEFVRSGGGFAGIHSAADTFYNFPEYGELLGGYFAGDIQPQAMWIKVEDTADPSTSHLGTAFEIPDEAYQFRNWDPSKLHLLLRVDSRSVALMHRPDLLAKRGNITDASYAVAWRKSYGAGKVFYTALGHSEQEWSDDRFLKHVVNGILETFPSKSSSLPAPADQTPLSDALLNFPWEWVHAPNPPDVLTFRPDGVATCPRFSWHWKITGPRSAIAYDATQGSQHLPAFKATLVFDETLSSLRATTSDGRIVYTGRRLPTGSLQPATPAPLSAVVRAASPVPATPAATTPPAVQAGTVWSDGTRSLTILERSGETFRGRFEIGISNVREFSGTIQGDRIACLQKDVRVLQGSSGGDFTGTVAGNHIDFVWHEQNGLGGKFTLTRTSASAATAASSAEAGFVHLLDREYLAGWRYCGVGTVQVSDGVATTSGGQSKGIYWYATRPLRNFTLRLSYSLDGPTSNSGIFLRFPALANDPKLASDLGYEVQIYGGFEKRHPSGEIWNLQPPSATPQHSGWNEMEITAVGQHYTVILNGQKVNDFTGTRELQGYIGFQDFPGSPVHLRDLRLKEL